MAKWPYNTSEWRFVRRDQLDRMPFCTVCGALADTVDHVTPIKIGGDPFCPSNLQSLCTRHHNQKTARHDMGRAPLGCDSEGLPSDPNHPWHGEEISPSGGKDRSGGSFS